MKQKITVILLMLSTYLVTAQVGINTNLPQTTLDVRATNHMGANTATDGVLVPRVTALSTDGVENGQLIFLDSDWTDDLGTTSTSDDIDYTAGFYFWSTATSLWTPINTNIEPWNEASTTNPATQNTQDIYTLGQVGIGTTNPQGALQITTENSRDVILVRFIEELNDDLDIDLFRSRGTVAAPNVVIDETRLGGVRAQSLINATTYKFRPAAEIYFESDGNTSNTSSPGKIQFATTPTGATSTLERMTIKENGNIGINKTDPETTLDVNGSVKITDGTQGPESVLTGDNQGNASWDRRAITKHTHTYMPGTTTDKLVDIEWIEIENNGTNGELTIRNTSTFTLRYAWHSNFMSNTGSGNLSAGSTTTIAIGTSNDVEIRATRYSSNEENSLIFQGTIISGNVKGFATFDQY
ncbi:hypothetical protein [Nonlabens tegetincola]|uniref:hypothetical protein n=1 Tax=Nonlabens tegetincola TaxID=323273 RepID=UPI000CF455BB|nr:hypothetical protein [Nonlabens tegetincola]PQJ18461.1 hypothetical protein BST93_08220 [Nonlabens tegetincola]